jgi:hypothetical protein
MCARFGPISLTPEQRKDRVTSCREIIAMADPDKNFFFSFQKLLRDMRPGVLLMTQKQHDRLLNGLVRYSFGQRN